MLVLGERLANGRRFWGLDLQGVANRTRLEVDRIAEIESGKANPLFGEIFWLSRLYRVSLDYLASLEPGPKQAQGSPAGAGTFAEVLDQVQMGARNGALSVVADGLLVREAVDHAVDQLMEALLDQEEIGKPYAWGLKVGKNEALRLKKRQRACRAVPFEDQVSMKDAVVDEEADGDPPFMPDLHWLGQLFARRGYVLTERQRTVVRAVLEHGSLQDAAEELGKKLSDVTETFERALQRLGAGLYPTEMPAE